MILVEDKLNQSFQEFEKTYSQIKSDYQDLIDGKYNINANIKSKVNKNIENFENSLNIIKGLLKYPLLQFKNEAEITKIEKKVSEMEEEMKSIIKEIKKSPFDDNSEINNNKKGFDFSSSALDQL